MMKKIKNKETLLNVLSSLILQICNIISTFIIPKIILNYFGSEVNGLISSLSQFLSYISLIEGGVTSVIAASLYKPLVDRNYKKISSIINTTNKFYRKIGFFFIIYSCIIAFAYPIIFKTGFSYIYVFSLTFILSINLFVQYMFSLSLKTLLTADKKVYIVSFAQISIILLNIVLVLVSVMIYPNIHLLKLISGCLFLLQPLIFSKYVKKNYVLDNNANVDNELLKNRWDGFAINVAAFIHFSTDITILTIFTDLSTVSIYSVYSLVTSGLRSIINSISNGINPTIGHALVKNNEDNLIAKFNIYEFLIILLVFFSFTIAGLLIVPFVMMYTAGINDTNYYQPLFGVLLLVSELLYLIKLPHLNLAYSANKFKEITIPAFIEAFLNIIISIILVYNFGLIGIAVGTIFGMLYRLLFHVNFVKKIIKSYSCYSFYHKVFIFSIATLIGLLLCFILIPFGNYTLFNWMFKGMIYSLLFGFIYFIACIIFFKKELSFLKKYFLKK